MTFLPSPPSPNIHTITKPLCMHWSHTVCPHCPPLLLTSPTHLPHRVRASQAPGSPPALVHSHTPQDSAPTGPTACLLRDCSLVISSKKPPHLPQDPSTWASPLGPLRIPSSACLSDSPRDVSSLRTGTMDNCVPGKMCSHHFQKAQASRLGHPAHWTLNIKAARPLVDPA